MKRYSTKVFEGMTREEVRDYVHQKYRVFQGTAYLNKCLNIVITVNKTGRVKTAKPLMSNQKAVVLLDLPYVLQNAVYNNWGAAQPRHRKFKAVGFLNFKYKCMVDGKAKSFRVSVIMTDGAKFQYSLEHDHAPQ